MTYQQEDVRTLSAPSGLTRSVPGCMLPCHPCQPTRASHARSSRRASLPPFNHSPRSGRTLAVDVSGVLWGQHPRTVSKVCQMSRSTGKAV